MEIDVLAAEIGSTTTVVNGFADIDSEPRFIGQGQALTTVLEGDVCLGLKRACRDLAEKLGADDITGRMFLAASSAAGGLGMTVHGLVYDMTVKAAKAAALGAGAVIRQTTAGKLRDYELEELKEINPKLILLAGGTDYGERDTALFNAEAIAGLGLAVPVIYAGNCQNIRAVEKIFASSPAELYVTENVYPKLDILNVDPCRAVIQNAFEKHIVKAPGMENIRSMVNGDIMPTPGAVMQAARLLYEDMGDLAVIDVGGATTDIHSVTPGTEEIAAIMTSPEPMAKRTVEGDLGVYINREHVLELIDRTKAEARLHINIDEVMADYRPIPQTASQIALTQLMTETAALKALERHAGTLRVYYTAQGRRTAAEGKDLTGLKTLIATGGALTRLPDREAVMRRLADCGHGGKMLFPKPGRLDTAFDNHYIFASLGVLSLTRPEAALKLMHRSMDNVPVG